MHAIRMGDWKLIDNTPLQGYPEDKMNNYEKELRQLYNLEDDPVEQIDLYSKYPKKAKELLDELNRIRNMEWTR